MASLKDSWKETGTELGHAFRDLGKAVVKTAKTGADKAEEWATKEDNQNQTSAVQNQTSEASQTEQQQTVSQPVKTESAESQPVIIQKAEASQEAPQVENQKTEKQDSLKSDWKSTGVGLGHAFRDLGKTVIKTAKTGADKAEEWANREDEPKN